MLGATAGAVTAKFEDNVFYASSSLASAQKSMFIAMPGQSVRYTASGYEFFGTPGNNLLPEALKTHGLSNSDGCGASLLARQSEVSLNSG